MLLFPLFACSDYGFEEKQEIPEREPRDRPEDTIEDSGTPPADDTGTIPDTDTTPVPQEECDGVDNDGDGETDEGFDANGNGIVDCFEEEAYCTPFDDFSGWSYTGTGSWHIEDGILTEGRNGSYAGIAYISDLGGADHFIIEASTAWTPNANDLTGLAWAVNGERAFIAMWDDPQNYYGRHSPMGQMAIARCTENGCENLAVDDYGDLYWPDDFTFVTWSVEVDGADVTVVVNGNVVLQANLPEVEGTGPKVVGVYSNDNDGGVWFDDFCVWVES
ncbi:MAG: hypothetical protein ACOZNI_25370 [Myxococcota bacterium]